MEVFSSGKKKKTDLLSKSVRELWIGSYLLLPQQNLFLVIIKAEKNQVSVSQNPKFVGIFFSKNLVFFPLEKM